MAAWETCFLPYWWLFPLAMIMLCLLLRCGRRRFRMCRFCSREDDGRETGQTGSAREILDMRYARGELSEQEYEKMKGVVGQGRAPEKT